METIANGSKFVFLDTGAIVVFLLKLLTNRRDYVPISEIVGCGLNSKDLMEHLSLAHKQESEQFRTTSVTAIACGKTYTPFDDLSSPPAIQIIMQAICDCLGNLIGTTKMFHILPMTVHSNHGITLEPSIALLPNNLPVNDSAL